MRCSALVMLPRADPQGVPLLVLYLILADPQRVPLLDPQSRSPDDQVTSCRQLHWPVHVQQVSSAARHTLQVFCHVNALAHVRRHVCTSHLTNAHACSHACSKCSKGLRAANHWRAHAGASLYGDTPLELVLSSYSTVTLLSSHSAKVFLSLLLASSRGAACALPVGRFSRDSRATSCERSRSGSLT